jgi:type I restriction enzyme M protein
VSPSTATKRTRRPPSSRRDGEAASAPLTAFEGALGKLVALIEPFAKLKRENDPLAEPWAELAGVRATLTEDFEAFGKDAAAQATAWRGAGRENAGLNAARFALHPLADRCRDLTKQIDLAAKLARRVIDIAVKELDARNSDAWDNGDVNKARKSLEVARVDAVEALRLARYFVRQADWIQERFPDAVLRDVEGLVKLVDRATIKAHDWSLTPGGYVGVAPEEQDQDFDFEEALRAIHIDLKGLNEDASELAARIARNFEELGA